MKTKTNKAVQLSKIINHERPLVTKHEKPKMPLFYGDVRKYSIFKADFQHAFEK